MFVVFFWGGGGWGRTKAKEPMLGSIKHVVVSKTIHTSACIHEQESSFTGTHLGEQSKAPQLHAVLTSQRGAVDGCDTQLVWTG